MIITFSLMRVTSKTQEGNEVVRSFYEFVRDHLGYRLNLQSESTVEAKRRKLGIRSDDN